MDKSRTNIKMNKYIIPTLIGLSVLLCSCSTTDTTSPSTPENTTKTDFDNELNETDIPGIDEESFDKMDSIEAIIHDRQIIPENTIDGITYSAYYKYDLTQTDDSFLSGLLQILEGNNSLEDINQYLYADNKALVFWKSISTQYHNYVEKVNIDKYGKNEFFHFTLHKNGSDPNYSFNGNYAPTSHFLWNNYKICFYYSAANACFFYIFPQDTGTGYYYVTDGKYGIDYPYRFFMEYSFECVNSIPEGNSSMHAINYQSEGITKSEIYTSGIIKNGLRDGHWDETYWDDTFGTHTESKDYDYGKLITERFYDHAEFITFTGETFKFEDDEERVINM